MMDLLNSVWISTKISGEKRALTFLVWFWGCSWGFHRIREKTPVPESLFNKVAGLRPAALLKERLWRRCFPASFAKFLGLPFYTEHLWWLLLSLTIITLFVCHHLRASFSQKISDLRVTILFSTIYLSRLNKVYTEIQSRTTLLLKCKHYCMLSKRYHNPSVSLV